MSGGYTHMSVLDVEDVAEKFGFGEIQEARFPYGDFEAEQTGFAFHRYKPGKRQAFGHRHDSAEEVYFVVSGSGRVKLDDEIIELRPLEAIRVSAGVMRSFEADEDGMEILAFGPRRADDRGEVVQGWWSD
jgi:mannose-6-phosphate isomerase-like protein (cupin superfamily)